VVVYVDLLFLLNLLVDAVLLYATAWSRRLKPPWWRLWLAAALGAGYVVLLFFPGWLAFTTFAVKAAFSLAMTAVAFGFRSLQFFLGNVAVFYLVNFCAAGGIFALHYLLRASGGILDGLWFTRSGGAAYTVEIGTVFIVSALVPVVYLFRTVWASARRRETLAQFKVEVHVRLAEETVSCTGLIDTGNQLVDPLTRTPVVVMEARCWGHLFGERWLSRIEHSDTAELLKALDEEVRFRHRFRFVPYHGIHKGTQFMLALKPDAITIVYGGRTITSERVLIGMKAGRLSGERAYQAIVHPGLLEAADAPGEPAPAAT
jgi:stage II sporulation protein GA (sporulation sigma-E factor processing peptidase)